MTYTDKSSSEYFLLLGLEFRCGVSLAFLVQCVAATSQYAKAELLISCTITWAFLDPTNSLWGPSVPSHVHQNSPHSSSHSMSVFSCPCADINAVVRSLGLSK